MTTNSASTPTPQPASTYDLEQGIRNFYASQAKAILAQWANIENLLGPTNDFTAPGTHCEVLLRDFLRRQLPSWVRVDKGFVYGRTKRWCTVKDENGSSAETECELHGPEIDLLIHDELMFRPVFRLEDFVIVQPEAVLGMIQVKRSFQANEFASAVANIVDGKRHLLECYFTANSSREHLPTADVFCAAVEFKESNRHDDTFRKRVAEAYESQSRFVDHEKQKVHAKTWTLPDFVGAIGGKYAIHAARNENNGEVTYQVLNGNKEGANIGLQELLIKLTSIIWTRTNTVLRNLAHAKPPLAPTLDTPIRSAFVIPEKNPAGQQVEG
jgi:hypothetical protein